MRLSWGVLCAVACSWVRVSAHPATMERSGRLYVSRSQQSDLESLASGYAFDDMPADKLARIVGGGLEDFEDDAIPMKGAKPASNDFVRLSLALEPDAEMLPAHYTGVKPPGVDHMELRALEPQPMASSPAAGSSSSSNTADGPDSTPRRTEKGGGAVVVGSKYSAEASKGEQGRKKVADFETSARGNLEKENRKGEYSAASGGKKSHSEEESHAKGHRDETVREKGAVFEVEDRQNKGRNSAGFRNVYHKDEYKNDADFYDNDHHSGHFRKHGRYNEKHATLEGAIQKGGKSESGYDQADAARQGKIEKARTNQEAQGHVAREGYDGFFKNFNEFAKKAALAEVAEFGFGDGKAIAAR